MKKLFSTFLLFFSAFALHSQSRYVSWTPDPIENFFADKLINGDCDNYGRGTCKYNFKASILYPQEIDEGNLNSKYDVIIFVTGGIPPFNPQAVPVPASTANTDIPEEYKKQTGSVSTDKSVPQLKKFLEKGGKLVTIGSSTNMAYHLGLPVRNHLVELGENGKDVRLPALKYYVPGSVLRVSVNNKLPSAWGMAPQADVYFDNSPVFRVPTDAITKGTIKPIMWFSEPKSLRSGWAWGQEYLLDGVTAFEAGIGKGKLYAFGPEITFRAQTHGTFKLLFNQLYGY